VGRPDQAAELARESFVRTPIRPAPGRPVTSARASGSRTDAGSTRLRASTKPGHSLDRGHWFPPTFVGRVPPSRAPPGVRVEARVSVAGDARARRLSTKHAMAWEPKVCSSRHLAQAGPFDARPLGSSGGSRPAEHGSRVDLRPAGIESRSRDRAALYRPSRSRHNVNCSPFERLVVFRARRSRTKLGRRLVGQRDEGGAKRRGFARGTRSSRLPRRHRKVVGPSPIAARRALVSVTSRTGNSSSSSPRRGVKLELSSHRKPFPASGPASCSR
jgi:hypothetical protein